MKRAHALALGAALLLAGVLFVGTAPHARALTTYVRGAPPPPQLEALGLADLATLAARGVTLGRPENHRSPLDSGTEFSTAAHRSADGTHIESWTLAQDEPIGEIILVPGYQASRESLLEGAAILHEAGWRVTLLDPRGVGGSGGDRTTLGWAESQDVAVVVEAAQARAQGPVVLYGFSMGGAAALRAVATGQAQADAVIVEGCFETLRGAIAARLHHLGLPATPIADLLLFWAWVDTGIPGWSHRPVDYAAQIAAPILVVQGTEDWRSPPSAGQAVARAAPAGRYATIEGLPHQPGFAGRPVSWDRVVRGFLYETFGAPDDPAEAAPAAP